MTAVEKFTFFIRLYNIEHKTKYDAIIIRYNLIACLGVLKNYSENFLGFLYMELL